MKRFVSRFVPFLILCSLIVAFPKIYMVEASGTIYIRSDGTVEGTDKIQRDGNVYTLTDNINDFVVVERENIVVDGAGYALQGTGDASYAWTTLQGDLRRTGYTKSPSPNSNQTFWKFQTGGAITSSPAVAAGMVFVGSNDGYLYALNVTTGVKIWDFWIGPGINSPTVAHGKVFITSDSGSVFAIDMHTGIQVWNNGMRARVGAPLVVGSQVLVNGQQSVFALDEATGEQLWREDLGAIAIAPLAYLGRTIFAVTSRYFGGDLSISINELYDDGRDMGYLWLGLINSEEVISGPTLNDGQVLVVSVGLDGNSVAYNARAYWERQLEGVTEASPAVAYDTVYIPTSNYTYALDPVDGSVKWRRPIDGEYSVSSPAVADGKVYFGLYNHFIYALDAFAGDIIWSYKTEGPITSSPAISDGLLFVGSGDGKLYAIGEPQFATPAPAVGKVYIRADGSVAPDTAPISTVDSITYTLTGSFFGTIVVERNNIVVDGAGCTIQGTGDGTGIDLSNRTGVTIKNVNIESMQMRLEGFDYGIYLHGSSNTTISGNNISDCIKGIYLYESSNAKISGNNGCINIHNSSDNIISENNGAIALYESRNNMFSGNNGAIYLSNSSNNTISRNNMKDNNEHGIRLDSSNNNVVSGNNITNNFYGILLHESSNNTISGNQITKNGNGIHLSFSSNNIIAGNAIANNTDGIDLHTSSNNSIHHNNFVNNQEDIFDWGWGSLYEAPSVNVWDDGYPSGGNYWSDYEDRYPNATELDDSNIWDTPYVIDTNNEDPYPLMEPVVIPEFPDDEKPTIPTTEPFPTTWIVAAIVIIAVVGAALLVYFGKSKKSKRELGEPHV